MSIVKPKVQLRYSDAKGLVGAAKDSVDKAVSNAGDTGSNLGASLLMPLALAAAGVGIYFLSKNYLQVAAIK